MLRSVALAAGVFGPAWCMAIDRHPSRIATLSSIVLNASHITFTVHTAPNTVLPGLPFGFLACTPCHTVQSGVSISAGIVAVAVVVVWLVL